MGNARVRFAILIGVMSVTGIAVFYIASLGQTGSAVDSGAEPNEISDNDKQRPATPETSASLPAGDQASTSMPESVRLRVVDGTTGDPVGEYAVAVLDHDPKTTEAWRIALANSTRTWVTVQDDEGEYEFAHGALDRVETLAVRAEGYAPAWTRVTAEKNTYVVHLAHGATIDGHVIDKNGNRIPGAKVNVGQREKLTDDSGTFRFESLLPGSLTIDVIHEAFKPYRQEIELASGGARNIQIVLEAGGAITGYVYREGNPVDGAKVTAMQSGDLAVNIATHTSNDGFFRLDGLAPGEWRVMATVESDEGKRELQQRAWVVEHQETQVVYDFAQHASIEGQITVQGVPASRASVRARSVHGYQEQFSDARANDEGWYALDIMPGQVSMTIEAEGTDGTTRKKIARLDVEPGIVTLHFEFGAPATLTGEISGVGANEVANVYVLPLDHHLDFESPQWGVEIGRIAAGHAIVQPNGSFIVRGLEPDNYMLVAVVFNDDARDESARLSGVRIVQQEVQVLDGGAHVQIEL